MSASNLIYRKDLSAAIWRPNVGAAELVLSRRSSTRDIGGLLLALIRGKPNCEEET